MIGTDVREARNTWSTQIAVFWREKERERKGNEKKFRRKVSHLDGIRQPVLPQGLPRRRLAVLPLGLESARLRSRHLVDGVSLRALRGPRNGRLGLMLL